MVAAIGTTVIVYQNSKNQKIISSNKGTLFYLWQNFILVKNPSLALNIILVIAVAFLYKKVYSGNDTPAAVIPHAAQNAHIVYVNSDSLLDHYDLFKTMKDKLDHKKDSIDHALSSQGEALQREAADYQSKAATMSEFERQTREEGLVKKQQELVKRRDGILEELNREDEALNDSVHSDLVRFLKLYNKSHGYDYILGYQRGSGVLLASDSLDITKQVVEGINKK